MAKLRARGSTTMSSSGGGKDEKSQLLNDIHYLLVVIDTFETKPNMLMVAEKLELNKDAA